MNKLFGYAIGIVIFVVGVSQVALAIGADSRVAVVASLVFIAIAFLAAAFTRFAFASATTATALIATAMASVANDVFNGLVLTGVTVAMILTAGVVVGGAVPEENQVSVRLANSVLGIEALTIILSLALGTSVASPLVALLGIAALGGLWLVARRHAMPTLAPHSNGA